ncbi:hypothetical protein GCM10009854_05090 [Saccharopolyspora halophila]|uniref:Uncharacterized protein n=1 Tax=Saccharopolyspora halophila TaxID=405551 RepID=A0ABP5SJR5_9PSEU
MVFDVFRRESTDVFWIVGAGFRVRHAMFALPGSVYTGAWVPALCEMWLLIPSATPFGQVPVTAKYTEQCAECELIVADRGHRGHVWDF